MKKIIAAVLVVAMFFGIAPLTGFDNLIGKAPVAYAQDEDSVVFGSYPQSLENNIETISKLDKIAKTWISYNYYDSEKGFSDFMQYADITYNGIKYRAVKLSQYRNSIQDNAYTNSYYTNWSFDKYRLGRTYYFRFEPLHWTVLDWDEGSIICDRIIDSQPYNYSCYSETEEYTPWYIEYDEDNPETVNYYYPLNGNGDDGRYKNIDGKLLEYWQDSNKKIFANDYKESSIRKWLNDNFYNTAFTTSEKETIETTELDNSAYPDAYSLYDSSPAQDKIYLLSYPEFLNADYEEYDEETEQYTYGNYLSHSGATHYAYIQGCNVWGQFADYRGTKYWLRNPSSTISSSAWTVGNDLESTNVAENSIGVRPVCRIKNLSSAISQTEADKVFFGSSTTYNHELGQFCADFARLGYDMTDKANAPFVTQLNEYGFTLEKMDPDADRDEVNYFIASKDATNGGKQYKIVFVGCIGSHEKQWYSNFDPEGVQRETFADRGGAPHSMDPKAHRGFDDAQEYVYFNLKNYIDDLKEDGYTSDSIKIVLTGHSRGAAAANLLAARLVNEQNTDSALAKEGNITAYTFATPRPTTDKKIGDSKYNCIFNIVNPEDFVTKVMLQKWGYGRYGITYTLPSRTNDKNWKTYLNAMRPYFKEYTGYTYEPYLFGEAATYTVINTMGNNVKTAHELYTNAYAAIWKTDIKLVEKWNVFDFFKKTLLPVVAEGTVDLGTFAKIFAGPGTLYREILTYLSFADVDLPKSISVNDIRDDFETTFGRKFREAHDAATYCAYMQALSGEQLKAKRKGYKGTVNCPVDIEIYDNETNELVGKITNNVIDETIAAKDNSVVMTVEGDSKEYWLPSNGDYTVKLTGNDNGIMDYTLSVIDPDEGEIQRKNVYDVPIKKDKTLSVAGAAENDVKDVTIVEEKGTSVGETKMIEDPAKAAVDITITTEGSGTATESHTVTEGDYVTLTAAPEEDNTFKGWYQGDVLVCDEAEYAFVAKTSVTLKAVFEGNKPTYTLGDVDGNGKIESADARLALRASVKLEKDIVEGTAKFLAADVNKDGKVGSDDARTILRVSVKLESFA